MRSVVLLLILGARAAAESPELRLSHGLSVQRKAVGVVEQLRQEGAELFQQHNAPEAREKFIEALNVAENALSESKVPLQHDLQAPYCSTKLSFAAACLKTGHFRDAEKNCDELLRSGWLSRAAAAQALYRRAKARFHLGKAVAAAKDCYVVGKVANSVLAARAEDLLEVIRAENGNVGLDDEDLAVTDPLEARGQGYATVLPQMPLSKPSLGDLSGLMNPMATLEKHAGGAPGFDPAQIMKNVNTTAVSKSLQNSIQRFAKKFDDPAFRKTTCTFVQRQDPKVWADRVKSISGDDPAIANVVENLVTKARSLAQPRRLERIVNYAKRGLWVRKRFFLPMQRIMKAAAPAFPFFVLWLWTRLYFKHRLARTLTKGALTGAAAATAMGVLMMPEADFQSDDSAGTDETDGEELEIEQSQESGGSSATDDMYEDVESEVIEL